MSAKQNWEALEAPDYDEEKPAPARRPSHRAILRTVFGRHCFYCGHGVSRKCGGTNKKLSVDHFIPKSKGGSNAIGNKVLSCKPCNGKKADRMPTFPEQARFRQAILRARVLFPTLDFQISSPTEKIPVDVSSHTA